LTSRSHYRRRSAVIAAALAGLWSLPAASQQSGTVLPETVTFLNTVTAVMEVEIAGAKTANSQTVVLMEFGPDGNPTTSPAPEPSLPDTVRFTLSLNGVSKVYARGSSDSVQPFPYKQVDLRRLQPSIAPGLYALSIIHLQDIPPGTAETWKLEITGLPPTGLRTIGSVTQGTFKSLTPVGNIYQPPEIAVSPAEFKTGGHATLTIAARGIDLSTLSNNEISISPDDDIGIRVDNASATTATVSFDLENSALPGIRSLAVRRNNVAVYQTFAVVQGPAIKISPPTWITGPPGKATLKITAIGDVDFSAVTVADVSVWSPTFELNVPQPRVLEISNRSQKSMTITLDDLGIRSDFSEQLFGLPLNIKANGGVLSGRFYALDHRRITVCEKSQHCCEYPADTVGSGSICISCRFNDQLCQ
jgi:hypothetical protein